MYCPYCGTETDENIKTCPGCGNRVFSIHELKGDVPNIGINILSFCLLPMLGIVMYFVWKNKKPRAAKSALIWALASIGLTIIFYLVVILVGIYSEL